jgi:hypothetical protein
MFGLLFKCRKAAFGRNHHTATGEKVAGISDVRARDGLRTAHIWNLPYVGGRAFATMRAIISVAGTNKPSLKS